MSDKTSSTKSLPNFYMQTKSPQQKVQCWQKIRSVLSPKGMEKFTTICLQIVILRQAVP